jgi:RNA polymerase-binding transcription factor DksA
MSGYGGVDDHNKNIEAVVENYLDVVRAQLPDPSKGSAEYCQDDLCGEPIPEGRRAALPGVQYCVECAPKHVPQIRIRAVDHIL